jgi:hypothetical protein
MKRATLLIFLVLTGMLAQLPPEGGSGNRREEGSVRLPNGKLQSEEILKDDYRKNLKDAQEIIDLGESLKMSLEKGAQHVLSISDLKKTEEIEKIARRIRGRIRRY